MRICKFVSMALILFIPAVLHAGQIYGSITSAGKPVVKAAVEVNCNGTSVKGATSADGSYRINVAKEGKCTLTLPNYADRPSAVIFSNPNPSEYNFEIVRTSNGKYELRRR